MTETLSSIGEFGLIDRIQRIIEQEGVRHSSVSLGIGDDAASFRPRRGYELLVTCDCIVEGRHYLSGVITPHDLGRRAMTLNISDIGAMGGSPLHALVSLGLKGESKLTDIEAIYRGFLTELNPLGASIIGGNLTKAVGAMFIDITLIGEVKEDHIVRRSTAEEGDVILVTGYPGQAAAGLNLLLKETPSPDLLNHPLVREYNTPSHRAREGRAVGLSGLAGAMIDTSDGFMGDLGHICDESNVGAVLYQNALPLSDALKSTARELGKDPLDLFLGESDDYELIMTCHPDNVPSLKTVIASVSDVPVHSVGRITNRSEGIRIELPDGTRQVMRTGGWDHFINAGE